jgi:hypothetical protein
MIKTIIAAAVFGLCVNAVAAVSDLSNVTHGSQASEELEVGEITQPKWSDRNAMNPRCEAKPFAQSAGNYRFGDLASVTHN